MYRKLRNPSILASRKENTSAYPIKLDRIYVKALKAYQRYLTRSISENCIFYKTLCLKVQQIFFRCLFTYLPNITDRTPLGFIPDIMVILQKYNLVNYSRLLLSRSRRDPLKHFEISVLRHIRFGELRKIPMEQPNFANEHVI